MTNDAMTNGLSKRKPIRWGRWLFLAFSVFVLAYLFLPLLLMRLGYKPLVFNESFYGHRYCMKQVGLALSVYANDNKGVFPAHPGGYGDALLLLYSATNYNYNYIGVIPLLTGPCYDWKVFEDAARTNGHVPESECGRVYVQGLTEAANPSIALIWDKQPTYGGDHEHGWAKLTAPLLREVSLLDGSMQRILERDWPEFSKKQIELLVETGIPRERAATLYAEKPKFAP
jgi:hypothetical protein